MSVDTNTNRKNLTPYRKLRHPDYDIYVSPVLAGMVSRMLVTTKGRFIRNLSVELGAAADAADSGCC